MRGHRSRVQNLALALLLGAAGASSSGGSAAAAAASADASVDSPWTVGAERILLWGEATEPLRGGGATLQIHVGSSEGGGVRAARAVLSTRLGPVAVPADERIRGLPHGYRTGARLLGLAGVPANAPPGS